MDSMNDSYNELCEAKIYIQQLEAENERLKSSRKSLQNNNKVLLNGNKKLMSKLAKVKKERDEAIEKLKRFK